MQKSLVYIESDFKVCEFERQNPNQTAGKVKYRRNYHYISYFCTFILPEVPFTRDMSFYNLWIPIIFLKETSGTLFAGAKILKYFKFSYKTICRSLIKPFHGYLQRSILLCMTHYYIQVYMSTESLVRLDRDTSS